MKKDVYYCIVLSDSQLDFLAGSKYGIDRMKVLKCLIDAVVIKETKYEKKGFAVTLHIGQAALSEVELATRLGYDKKTVSRLLDKMAELGIVTSEQTNRTSIHTVHCVSAWYTDNQKILNPYYVSVKERHHCVGEIGDNGIDKDGISAIRQMMELESRIPPPVVTVNSRLYPLFWAIMFMTETERKT